MKDLIKIVVTVSVAVATFSCTSPQVMRRAPKSPMRQICSYRPGDCPSGMV